MVLAEAREVDVLDDHHLIVVLDEQRVVEDLVHALRIAGREVPQRLLDSLRRLGQAFTVRVFTELLQQLLDELGDHSLSPRYSKRFFAVSTTDTRCRLPRGATAGASTRQNARASPSPVVITPARAGASSSFRWSTWSSTRRSTRSSSAARSTAIPVTGSGTPATLTSR